MFVTVNGIRLFCDVLNPKLALTPAGADELPTLLCIHGGPGGDHMSLRPEIDLLCPSAHVVLFDQRGGGRSDAGPQQQWTLDQWADDVAGLCDALGIVKPIVFGNSGGGMVALRYAERHPNHAGALVLVSTAPRIVPADRIADFERRGGPAAGAAARGMFERCTPEDFGPYMRHCLPLYMRRPLSDGAARATRSRFSLDVNRHFFAPGGEAWRMDLRSGLTSIRCPTLVLSGIDDPMTPAELGREIAQAIPNSQYELFEQSSHGLMSDEPDKFAAVVAAFIAKCLRQAR